MSISVSPLAAQYITKSLAARGRGIGIKVGVTTSECAGMSYVLEYVDTAPSDSVQFRSQDVLIFSDAKSLVYLDGCEIDFKIEAEQSGFLIHNPNARGACSCGDSFNV